MKSRTEGGRSTGGRKSMSASAYSACSRADPPPVKNACSVCAASWMTRSPSTRPGQPRSRSFPFGENMQSFTQPTLAKRLWTTRSAPSTLPGDRVSLIGPWPLGLGVHDHVGDVRPLAADSLFDLARLGVRVVEATRSVEAEREERDQAAVRSQEAQLARLPAGGVADDPPHERLPIDRNLEA